MTTARPAPLATAGPEVSMLRLAKSIPCLARRLGDTWGAWDTWDPMRLVNLYPTASSGERAAIAFVLNVWNNDWRMWLDEHGIHPFTIQDFARLDKDNAAAIAAWFQDPFFP